MTVCTHGRAAVLFVAAMLSVENPATAGGDRKTDESGTNEDESADGADESAAEASARQAVDGPWAASPTKR